MYAGFKSYLNVILTIYSCRCLTKKNVFMVLIENDPFRTCTNYLVVDHQQWYLFLIPNTMSVVSNYCYPIPIFTSLNCILLYSDLFVASYFLYFFFALSTLYRRWRERRFKQRGPSLLLGFLCRPQIIPVKLIDLCRGPHLAVINTNTRSALIIHAQNQQLPERFSQISALRNLQSYQSTYH